MDASTDAAIMTTLRCYAYSGGGRWHGICTDLDIAVDGRSYKEVEASLETCINMYLKSIAELLEKKRRRLLARRAPLRVRAWWAMSTWVYQLAGASDRHALARPDQKGFGVSSA